jgi:hypothetical protein
MLVREIFDIFCQTHLNHKYTAMENAVILSVVAGGFHCYHRALRGSIKSVGFISLICVIVH